MWLRLRLALFTAAFLAWLGWLGVEAFRRGRFPVVSQAQLLMADLDVVARVAADPSGAPLPVVTVVAVLWPAGRDDLVRSPQRIAELSKSIGFTEPGEYLLPLCQTGDGLRLAAPPTIPGLSQRAALPRVYPAIPIVLDQQRRIRDPRRR